MPLHGNSHTHEGLARAKRGSRSLHLHYNLPKKYGACPGGAQVRCLEGISQ